MLTTGLSRFFGSSFDYYFGLFIFVEEIPKTEVAFLEDVFLTVIIFVV
jgi:hypothetical protein